ncbi:MAG TPA: beta-L-arabinofuranosidase domain-containing protein [Rectinemataceae bacterium]|nr:beta-L-arabinofuranosidase domain-containing protein [Rectinemataceae bacterium]
MTAALQTQARALAAREESCRVLGGFWKAKQDMIRLTALPYQWRALNDEIPGAEPSRAIGNFRIAAGEAGGESTGTVFQDSEVYKWLEAASRCLELSPDPGLEARVDEVIRLVAKAQRPDGYLNSYFTVVAPGQRWTNLAWGHELYGAGHLIEAAVAHNRATGSKSLLGVAERFARHIDDTFGPEEGKIHGACGHPEIELALFRLWRLTRNPRYRNLATYFVEQRGRDPDAFASDDALGQTIPEAPWRRPDYFVAQAPVRELRGAEGHAVRAVYLYAAMADECAETGDPELAAALGRLWDSAVGARMYVTGGLGSQAEGERFSVDHDLPSGRAYTETCAAIGFIFWAHRMSALFGDARYGDALERSLYNGALSGISAEGTRYFYVNPLELQPAVARARHDHKHVKLQRVEWFGCSCCPPNIARLVSSIGDYAYLTRGATVVVDHYLESAASFELPSGALRLTQHTDYPWSGAIGLDLALDGESRFSLALRIPGWCDSFRCSVNGEPAATLPDASGYLSLERLWRDGDRVELELDMPVRFLSDDPRIAELAGKVALQRGPLVYCVEQIDNGPDLHSLVLDPSREASAEFDPALLGGSVRISAIGFREEAAADGDGSRPAAAPYHGLREDAPTRSPVTVSALPYHLWGNRQPGAEMRVWLRRA